MEWVNRSHTSLVLFLVGDRPEISNLKKYLEDVFGWGDTAKNGKNSARLSVKSKHLCCWFPSIAFLNGLQGF